MAIHHAQHRQAEQYGFTLEEKPPHVRAFHPSSGTQLFGVSAKDAIAQMLAVQNILKYNHDIRFTPIDDPRTHGYLRHEGEVSDTGTPIELHRKLIGKEELNWRKAGEHGNGIGSGGKPSDFSGGATITTVDNIEDTFEPDAEKPVVDDTPLIKRSENGVPLDGAIAYKEGVMAADNPFEEGSEEGDEWDVQWDQAADDAPEAEEGKGGSVVASRYRTKYAEEGHPNHCGDWLAELLNNYCIGDKHTDLAVFEQICGLNGVDTGKYRREGNGWQGRIRMTGRNLLAKKVHAAGKITVPTTETDSGTQIITAPADWLASRPYKTKAE